MANGPVDVRRCRASSMRLDDFQGAWTSPEKHVGAAAWPGAPARASRRVRDIIDSRVLRAIQLLPAPPSSLNRSTPPLVDALQFMI